MSGSTGRQCSRRRSYVSLENLGNTCYMNSILQVLRYTSGFVHYLNTLSRAIRWVEHRQLLETCDNFSNRTVKHAASRPLVWAFVQDLCSLYNTMSKHEETVSAASRLWRQLTIKPKKIMDSLCKLNMMYTGNSQHDAHELLRCILSYINEAAQEVRRRWPADVHCGSHVATCSGSECNESAAEFFSTRSSEVAAASFDVQQPATILEAAAVTCLSSVVTDAHRSQQFLDNLSASQLASLKSVSVVLTRLPVAKGASHLASSSNSNPGTFCSSSGARKRMNPYVLLHRIDGPDCSRSRTRRLQQRSQVGASDKLCPRKEHHCDVQARHSKSVLSGQHGVHCVDKSFSRNDKACCGCGNFLQNGRCPSLQRLFEDADASFRLFQGECIIKKRCLECETIATHSETFDEIMIPVCKAPPSMEEDPAILSDGENDCHNEKPTDDCLFRRAFQGKERLQGENKYSCSNCCHYTQADISTHYRSVPPIMTFYLKRFSVSAPGDGGHVVKVNDHVSTPLVLPCFVCTVGCDSVDHRYYLYAIVMHSGSSVSSGHYKSYIRIAPSADCRVADNERAPCGSACDHSPAASRHLDFGAPAGRAPARGASAECFNWIECNDEFVRPCTASDVTRQLQRCSMSNRLTPYLLFYRKGSDSRMPGLS